MLAVTVHESTPLEALDGAERIARAVLNVEALRARQTRVRQQAEERVLGQVQTDETGFPQEFRRPGRASHAIRCDVLFEDFAARIAQQTACYLGQRAEDDESV
ncbi:hypothetical protein [Pandoraea oxalativorans]|uniref:hypothetical protein n=1 Tax=Pandoraea oxalativorans TaxID=573737 RepID=UPI0012F4DF9A|nr:hypothetical protein [Pandoraea oxalativorans]